MTTTTTVVQEQESLPQRYNRERNGYLQGGSKARTFDDERRSKVISEKQAKLMFYQKRSAT